MTNQTKIKLNAAGEQLPDDATDHVIVHNVRLGLHETVRAPGFEKSMLHKDVGPAIQALNDSNYLGHNNWRAPQPWEELEKVKYVNEDVMADLSLYPDMQSGYYWTNEPVPWSSDFVFCVYFCSGSVGLLLRNYKAFVRPVRSVLSSQ